MNIKQLKKFNKKFNIILINKWVMSSDDKRYEAILEDKDGNKFTKIITEKGYYLDKLKPIMKYIKSKLKFKLKDTLGKNFIKETKDNKTTWTRK